jgi:hypothetical protein
VSRLRLVPLFALACCDNPDPKTGELLLYPMTVGSVWTYDVEDGATHTVKTQTCEVEEDVGGARAGITAFRLRTEKRSTGGLLIESTVSWQSVDDALVKRYREQVFNEVGTMTTEEYYDPYKLRLDGNPEHTALGATWTVNYSETINDGPPQQRSEQWSVEGVGVSVSTPAGDFDCLQVRRHAASGVGSDKTFYFAPSVGKVREEGGQTEVLRSYEP